MSKITVRVATMADMPWIRDVAGKRMLVEEYKRPRLYNGEHIETMCSVFLPQGCTFIAENDGTPVGILAAALVDNMFNPQYTTLTEIFWWVDPAFRHTRAAFLLIKSFERKLKMSADDATFSLIGSSIGLSEHFVKAGWIKKELGLVKEI